MYNKLFTKILDSTIWLESWQTRLVWITLLACMDEDGFCALAVPANVANRANVPLDETRKALEILMAPDPDSSDPDNDGRRVERVPGGYVVLNAGKYREQVTRTESKRQNRDRVARHRLEKAKDEPPAKGGFVYYAQNGLRVKIGWSINPWARINDLRCACPDIVLLATEKGMYPLEGERHAQFAIFRKEREWFDLSEPIRAHIASLSKTTETPSVATTEEIGNATVMQSVAVAVAVAVAEQNQEQIRVSFELPVWVDPEIWDTYLEIRASKKAAKTPRAWRAVIKQLDLYRNHGHDPNSILETSIRSNWTDVYEPKIKGGINNANSSNGNGHSNHRTNEVIFGHTEAISILSGMGARPDINRRTIEAGPAIRREDKGDTRGAVATDAGGDRGGAV